MEVPRVQRAADDGDGVAYSGARMEHFPSSAGIGPFISFHFQMRDSSYFNCTIMGKREKLQDVHTVILMKQIDSFEHCSCHMY